MIYGSVCSGIEAATVAWEPLGWKPSFFSEIEKFPRAVLKHHYLDVPLHGDFTTIKGDDYEPIDLLVGGTPCQSFSVAGLRKGLDDERGNLALEYLKLAKRLGARWLVWENVPGVLSSNGGRDFGSFLGALGELGYGFAYRVLDAQYIGVPQRRRRVFVVGYLGDWRYPAAVLFERHSMCGHSTPRREKRKAVACLTANGVGTCGADDTQAQAGHLISSTGNVAHCLNAGGMGCQDYETETMIVHGTQDPCVSDKAFALGGNSGQENAVIFPIHDKATRHKGGGCRQEDGVERNDGAANGLGIGGPNDPCYTITSGDKHAIAYDTTQITSPKNYSNPKVGDPCHPLASRQHPPLITGMQVRRLTPIECERLQGLPDNYTLIDWQSRASKKKIQEDVFKYFLRQGFSIENATMAARHPDGPRYKAIGNSMHVGCMHLIGKRIKAVDNLVNSH